MAQEIGLPRIQKREQAAKPFGGLALMKVMEHMRLGYRQNDGEGDSLESDESDRAR